MMLKRMTWTIVAFLFLASALFQLFVFTCLFLWQEVTYFEFNVNINYLEFGFSLMVVTIALFVFGYSWKELLGTKNLVRE